MEKFTVTPESYNTSLITPLILSETEHTKTQFALKQVYNKENLKQNLKGTLIIQKKNKDITSFEDSTKFTKKDIKASDIIKIAFDTQETYELAKGLYNYYKTIGGKKINPFEETYILKDKKIDYLINLLQNKNDLLSAIKDIDLCTLNLALNIENLRRVKNEMEQNLNNDDEAKFWQTFFTKNAWILSQLFHAPVIYFKNMRYVGGKSIDNTGGKITDFIYQNPLSLNIALIEIKSPVKKLIKNAYRQTFSLSEDLSGGINQLLQQKQTLYNDYATLLLHSKNNFFEASNVESILLIGKIKDLSDDELRVFNLYRNELRSVKIICFDELLEKIKIQLELFSNQ